MKFSIIIPAYNIERYVKECITSAINQSFNGDYEIIVIDDGSNDKTGNIIDEFKGIPKLLIFHQQNRGLSATRNYGVSVAKGEFVLYLDGDDWLAPNALSLIVEKTINADLVVFPMVYYYDENNFFKKSYSLDTNKVYNSRDFLHNTIGRSSLNITPAQCKAYRKSILVDKKQSFIEGILHEDGPYFSDTLCNYNRIAYIDEGIYFFRQNRAGSITSYSSRRHFEGILAGLERIKQNFGTSNKDINYMMSCMCVFRVMVKYKDHAEKDVISYFRRTDQKMFLLKLFFHSTFVFKQEIRLLLMIIDPALLRFVTRLVSK